MSKQEEAQDLPFEDLLNRLEQTVDRIEQPDISLDEALEVYEEGVQTLRTCLARLKSAEGKVETLMKEGENLLRNVPFEPSANEKAGEDYEDDETAPPGISP